MHVSGKAECAVYGLACCLHSQRNQIFHSPISLCPTQIKQEEGSHCDFSAYQRVFKQRCFFSVQDLFMLCGNSQIMVKLKMFHHKNILTSLHFNQFDKQKAQLLQALIIVFINKSFDFQKKIKKEIKLCPFDQLSQFPDNKLVCHNNKTTNEM